MNKQNTITENVERLLDILANKDVTKEEKEIWDDKYVKCLGCGEIFRNPFHCEEKNAPKGHDYRYSEDCQCMQKYNRKPVMIGDVLEKLRERDGEYDHGSNNAYDLMGFYSDCGFTASLNEILSGEVEDITETNAEILTGKIISIKKYKQFKDKNIQNLYELLMRLFSNQIT